MKPLAQNTLIQNRYLIVQLIGKGGMGEVYLAVDQRLGSAIALKRTFFAGDEMLGNAFEREARVLARLRHPVLPKVSDHFGEGEEQFLVMEHISGDDLSVRIEAQQKPFPLSWVMFWADQLLDALSYLHSHEPPIIHRDIKPQNLKLTDENHIILLDFGLSKTSTGQTNISGGNPTGSTGSVVGYTPHYAPMEQIRGIGTSAKSDLYSLSATLYQLMTNTIPADALTRADSMLNGLPDPIKSPSDINPEIGPGVSDVILKGMEISQDKRFGTAKEMQKALRRAYNEMKQAMSAKTMVISSGDLPKPAAETNGGDINFDATEVMDPAELRAQSELLNSGAASDPNPSLPQPSDTAGIDLGATVAFDPGAISEPIRQAEIKTEVFTGSTFSTPADNTSGQIADVPPSPLGDNNVFDTADSVPSSSWDSTTSTSGADMGADTGAEHIAQATVPLIAFDAGSAGSGTPPPPDDVPFGHASDTASPRDGGTSFPGGTKRPAPTPAVKPAKKGSTGKIVAILGGLFLFFVVLLGIGFGGWYYYENYYAVTQEPTPTPSPEPTPELTPTPDISPTPLFGADNSNVNSNSNTNTNSNSNTGMTTEPTPTPTPVPQTDQPSRTDRPDTKPGKPTPPKQQQPTPPKGTKTPPKKSNDTDILQ